MVRAGLTTKEKRGEELVFGERPEVPRVNFRERSLQISKKEFETYALNGLNEDLVRILTGSFENRSAPGGPASNSAQVAASPCVAIEQRPKEVPEQGRDVANGLRVISPVPKSAVKLPPLQALFHY